MQNNESKFKKSFTLIELMVSMSILVVAIIAAMGIYINVIGSRERTLGQVNVQEDGQYLMSLIVKDIRAGIIDYLNYGEIVSPENELLLLDFLNNQIRYRITPATPIIDGACSISRCTLERCENADCSIADNYQTITMSDVSIERLDFYINPPGNPFTHVSTIYTHTHPRITIVLKLKSLIEKTGKEELILQQTVPQRYTYRK